MPEFGLLIDRLAWDDKYWVAFTLVSVLLAPRETAVAVMVHANEHENDYTESVGTDKGPKKDGRNFH